ncbi:DUF1574 family protein [Tundrisphaera sp. TA3]|uniref:DUF1574 family protein n=1 Tax=Tundrisphaera sp. TA3 TaxID=3435775 RepID=UPI003EBD477A
MLALILAIEATLSGHDMGFTYVWHWDWRIYGKAVASKAKRCDLLLLGDSLVKFGVIPRVVRDRSGMDGFNAALHVGQTSTSYFMLRRALEGGAKPKAILLDLTPHLLAQAPDENNNLWGELLRPGEAFDLAWAMGRDSDFFARTLAASYVPSFRERFEIRKGIAAALEGKSTSSAAMIRGFRRNWRLHDGAQLNGDGAGPDQDWDAWTRTLYSRWAPHPVNLAYLDRLLGLARDRGIPVLWYLPVIHPEVQARTEQSGFDASYTRFVEEVRARHPEVTVIDARKAEFAADLFTDGAHLTGRGALKLSAAFGDLLRDRSVPGSGRWIPLDASASPPDRGKLEDVWRSVAIADELEKNRARR